MIEQTIGRLRVLVPAVFVALFLALGLTVLLRLSLARHAMAAAPVAVAWLFATFARGR
jgi:hypothetical protein